MKTTIIYEGNVIYDLPQLEVGDFGQIFTFHIKTEVNGAYDLTDKIVTFKAKTIDGTEDYLFTGACVLTTASAGYCTYKIASSNLTENGSFECSLEITEVGIEQSSIDLGYLNINKDN